jgi:hypothetical protein
MYPAAEAAAHRVRAELLADDDRAAAAGELDRARLLLEPLTGRHPNLPEYRGDLGRVYLAVGRVARDSGDPASAAGWLNSAIAELERAVNQSPESAADLRSLAEARAARAEVSRN